MPKRIVPCYPESSLDKAPTSTVAVRLSPIEVQVLDYMVKQSPGDHSRGGLLRAFFRGVVRPAGQIIYVHSIKGLRLNLQKKSLVYVGEDCEIKPDRVVVVMPPGNFKINAPIVSDHNYWVMGAGWDKTRFEIDLFPLDFEESKRFCSCTLCFKGELEIVKE